MDNLNTETIKKTKYDTSSLNI